MFIIDLTEDATMVHHIDKLYDNIKKTKNETANEELKVSGSGVDEDTEREEDVFSVQAAPTDN